MRTQLIASTALLASLALIAVPARADAASCGGNYMVQDKSVDVVYSWDVDVFHAWQIETRGAVSCADARGFVRQEAERRGVHSHCLRHDAPQYPGRCSHALEYGTLDGWPGWRDWGNMGSAFAWKGSEDPNKATARITWNYEYPENVTCIFVDPDAVVGLGHVAWAFRDASAGIWWYGSTDGPNVQSYWETVSGQAWDSRTQSFKDVFASFKSKGAYKAYRCAAVAHSNADQAEALATEMRMGWGPYPAYLGVTNNCLTRSVDIARAYGVPELVLPLMGGHFTPPRDYYVHHLSLAGFAESEPVGVDDVATAVGKAVTDAVNAGIHKTLVGAGRAAMTVDAWFNQTGAWSVHVEGYVAGKLRLRTVDTAKASVRPELIAVGQLKIRQPGRKALTVRLTKYGWHVFRQERIRSLRIQTTVRLNSQIVARKKATLTR